MRLLALLRLALARPGTAALAVEVHGSRQGARGLIERSRVGDVHLEERVEGRARLEGELDGVPVHRAFEGSLAEEAAIGSLERLPLLLEDEARIARPAVRLHGEGPGPAHVPRSLGRERTADRPARPKRDGQRHHAPPAVPVLHVIVLLFACPDRPTPPRRSSRNARTRAAYSSGRLLNVLRCCASGTTHSSAPAARAASSETSGTGMSTSCSPTMNSTPA